MKKFFLGLLIGIMLATASSVYADDIAKLVGKTVDNEYPVLLNGVQLGNKAPSIEGTSYAPVREISEKLGLNVEFKDDTVYLSKPLQSEATNVENPDLETLERMIKSRKLTLHNAEESLKQANPIAKPTIAIEVQKLKDELAELERQKAELEQQKAELTKTP